MTRRYGRRTERLRSTPASVGLALAGRAGARLARVFGVSVSRSTVLRLVEALPDPEAPAPRVVGVDEYATRKGRHYGTVLVDVETRRPVDLLPDREASSLAGNVSLFTDSQARTNRGTSASRHDGGGTRGGECAAHGSGSTSPSAHRVRFPADAVSYCQDAIQHTPKAQTSGEPHVESRGKKQHRDLGRFHK
ncbi:hypothetical protein [Streptomyces sp. NPDC046161]|uniref:hypothetical protein n=1 Tax=Streptomyces sp. NPDC046161 TaxID=3155132 RepID=UPI0033F68EA6